MRGHKTLVGVCSSHTGPPKEPVVQRFGSSHLEEEAVFVALLAELERRENELRLREPSSPRRGFNDFIACSFSLFHAELTASFGFCKLRKVVCIFFLP